MTPDGFRFSPLGLVVAEHIDKIAFFEPGLSVIDKEIQPDALRFALRITGSLQKPLEEILRGYRIGCFRIAREYHLIRPDDSTPIFEATTLTSEAEASGPGTDPKRPDRGQTPNLLQNSNGE